MHGPVSLEPDYSVETSIHYEVSVLFLSSVHKGQLMAARPENDGQLAHPVCVYMRQEVSSF